ncbi:exosortase H-associated membrane protein [Brevundimonas sp.]|uniref:exosortase H-associated membrane protein n=1 Tax=Brevundimonas sp. TaxID=1871086 RepID=UPI00260AB787|nr:exosortase H-associated membrane protein [Brevundimonas sp.]
MSLFARFQASTPEEAARRRFAIWACAGLILFLPSWWLWGADLAAQILRPLAGLVMSLLGLTGRIDVSPQGDWSIGTRLTQAGQPFVYEMSATTLRRLLLGFPLVAAFMIAPPRTERPWRAAGVSIAVLSLMFALGVVAVVWGDVGPGLQPDAAAATAAQAVVGRFDQSAIPGVLVQIAVVGRYLALSIAPLLAAAMLWAMLNPAGFRTLVAEITE